MIDRYIRVFADAISYAKDVSRGAQARYVFDTEWTMWFQVSDMAVEVFVARHYMGTDGRMQTSSASRQWNRGGGDVDNQLHYWLIKTTDNMSKYGVEDAN